MSRLLSSVLCAVLLSSVASAAPSGVTGVVHATVPDDGTPVVSVASPSPTVPYASDNANGIMWSPDTLADVQAIRGSLGATILGPQNVALDQQNPDLLAPPTTDHGNVYAFFLCWMSCLCLAHS